MGYVQEEQFVEWSTDSQPDAEPSELNNLQLHLDHHQKQPKPRSFQIVQSPPSELVLSFVVLFLYWLDHLEP